ncbi:unnamed protein product [Peronospora destructor]|uniref:Uncharacterized protein n=1 Tax=Peronospora destructor TaxID=86335 RepID=A0AAV0VEU0_9STRA|nr:unnamed protein product [Peronospora destructor]
MMKISALAIAAAIAIANVSAAYQPALRSAAMPAEAAPGAMTTPDGKKKEQFWGGPWGGLGWGGRWGGGCCGGFGWGCGLGWDCFEGESRIEMKHTFTPTSVSFIPRWVKLASIKMYFKKTKMLSQAILDGLVYRRWS